MTDFQSFHDILKNLDTVEHSGKVMKVVGLTVESNGPAVNMGNICRIYPSVGDDYVEAEVVGFRDQRVLLMPFGDMTGIGFGSRVVSTGQSLRVAVSDKLVGRVLNALGKTMDDGPAVTEDIFYPVDNMPPNPLTSPDQTPPVEATWMPSEALPCTSARSTTSALEKCSNASSQ